MNKSIKYSTLVLICYVVLHAPISTLLIDNFGHKDFFKSAKDIFIFSLLAVALVRVWRQGALKNIFRGRIVVAIALYAALSTLVTIFSDLGPKASLAGFLFNFRFLAVFLVALAIRELSTKAELKKFRAEALRLVAIGGVGVVAFGLLQITVLPDDFLSHLGYGTSTIGPFDTVDQNDRFVRIISTLRGANVLGIYLILIATVSLGHLLKGLNRYKSIFSKGLLKDKWLIGVALASSLMVMYFTYSRAAAAGAIISFIVIFIVSDIGALKKHIVHIGLMSALILGVLLTLFRDTDFVSYTLFHSDQQSVITDSSNSLRLTAYRGGLQAVADRPFGYGLGESGPASVYGNNPKVSENYYIQIAQEAGILGLGLLLYIFYNVSKNMFKQRVRLVPATLLASFIGISTAGMFMHVWTDETISIIWWTLAGLWYKP